MLIFTSIASVFIESGFSTALIQNKDVTEDDYSSVFWLSLFIACILYLVIFVTAPAIAVFYNSPILTQPLRTLALMIIPGSLSSIQQAKLSREMDFRKIFISSIISVSISGIVGVIAAYLGLGLWALVAQSLLNVLITSIVLLFLTGWYPRFVFNVSRIVVLFRFGWKLLVSGLLDTVDNHLQNIIVGKKYTSATLGYYDKGIQFPQYLVGTIVSSVQSVLLPAMSAEQDNSQKVKELAKSSMCLCSYIIFPMMAGLASIAEPLVCLLLTEKWLPCVPYIRVNCFIYAFFAVHVCNLQAINSLGRSDLFLRLELIKKVFEIIFISIAVFCFDSPMAIAMTGVFDTFLCWYINAAPNKMLIQYPFKQQIIDLIPMALMSVGMFLIVYIIPYFVGLSMLVTMIIQIMVGVCTYVLMSVLFKPEPYQIIIAQIKNYISKKS